MARITQEKKNENLEMYSLMIRRIFFEEGFRAITYARLGQELNIRQSTLQGYFPSVNDFLKVLKGHLLPVLIKNLCFKSEESFVKSWDTSFKHKEFRHSIALILSTANSESPAEFNTQGIRNFDALLQAHFGDNHRDLLERVLGRSFLILSDYQ